MNEKEDQWTWIDARLPKKPTTVPSEARKGNRKGASGKMDKPGRKDEHASKPSPSADDINGGTIRMQKNRKDNKREFHIIPPPKPPMGFYYDYHIETINSKEAKIRHDAGSAFWTRMVEWVRDGMTGEMPYPKDAVIPEPRKWYQFWRPRFTAEDRRDVLRFVGEVEEFARWTPQMTNWIKNGR